jgi:hypothetical protein
LHDLANPDQSTRKRGIFGHRFSTGAHPMTNDQKDGTQS